MKYFMLVWKHKKFVILTSLVFALIFFAYSCFNTYYTENIMISFIYPNSEKGKYPDGTRFNIYDLLSNEVLEGAVKGYNKEVPSHPILLSDVDGNIVLQEYLTTGVQQKVTEARNQGVDYRYFANEFIITCHPMYRVNINDKSRFLGFLPYVDNKIFVKKLYESYANYFMDEHAEKNILSGLMQNLKYDDYDYIEMAEIFEQRIDKYINYLNAKNAENGAFRSVETQLTFNDLINSFRNLKNVQVNKLKSFVSSSKLSKNPEVLVNKLQVKNETDRLDYNKFSAEAALSKSAMEQYDHTFEENVVVAGRTESNEIYQTRAKTAYDDITNRALSSGVKAENILKDIEENERLIQLYKSSTMLEDERIRLSAIAEDMVLQIEKLNTELVEKADKTVEEYLTSKSSDYIRKDMMDKNYISLMVIIKTAIVFVFVAMCAMGYIFIKNHQYSIKKVKIKKKDIKKAKLEFDNNATKQ